MAGIALENPHQINKYLAGCVQLAYSGAFDCKSTVSHRALALEHAHYRLTFFFKELPSARIREAPQLPVVWQISRSLRNPRCEQQVQVPRLLIILHGPVTYVSHQAVNVEGKPLQELVSSGTRGERSHDLWVRFEECFIVCSRATGKNC
jgi:hypothetical protein